MVFWSTKVSPPPIKFKQTQYFELLESLRGVRVLQVVCLVHDFEFLYVKKYCKYSCINILFAFSVVWQQPEDITGCSCRSRIPLICQPSYKNPSSLLWLPLNHTMRLYLRNRRTVLSLQINSFSVNQTKWNSHCGWVSQGNLHSKNQGIQFDQPVEMSHSTFRIWEEFVKSSDWAILAFVWD